MYNSLVGTLIKHIAHQRLHKHTPYKEYEHVEYFFRALSHDKVTVFATHSHADDIAAIDYFYQEANQKPPMFIMRDTLRIRFGGGHFPIWFSQHLYVNEVRQAIPINQQDPHAMANAMPKIKQTFDNGQHLVVFPGATRHCGYVNPLVERSSRAYAALIKRNKLHEDHVFLPLALVYTNDTLTYKFAKAQPLQKVKTLTSTLVDLCGQKDMCSLQEVQDVLKDARRLN